MRYCLNPDDIYRFAAAINAAVKQRGDELTFTYCPYCGGGKHRDKDTFSVNLKTGAFKCLRASCLKQGHFVELARDFGFDLGLNDTAKRYKPLPQKEITPTDAAIEYMRSRGISEEVTRRYRLTTRTDNTAILVLPFYDENGVLVSVKYRKIDFVRGRDKNKEWFEKDTKPILFGMNLCTDFTKPLIITEGQIDCLSLAECGIENVVSVPTGANGFTWLANCWIWIMQFSEIIVFGDFENGHMSIVDELRKRLNIPIRQVRAEDYLGEKDANDILRRYGKQAIITAIENAYLPPLNNVKSLSDVEAVDLNTLPKIHTGITEIDRIIGGLMFGQVTLLSGRRGEGKSTLMSQFVVEAIEQDQPVFVYSGELTAYHFKRWLDLQAAGNMNLIEHTNEYGDSVYSLSDETIDCLNEWYRGKAFIYDSGSVPDENEGLLDTIEKAIRRYGIKLVCIDNLMTALDVDLSDDLYRGQSKFVKRLKSIAVQYNVAVLLVAHPKKTNGAEFDNDFVSGSADITNAVDVVMAYSRSNEGGCNGLLSITKNRLTGQLATGENKIRLWYDPPTKRITGMLLKNKTYSWAADKYGMVDYDYESDELPF